MSADLLLDVVRKVMLAPVPTSYAVVGAVRDHLAAVVTHEEAVWLTTPADSRRTAALVALAEVRTSLGLPIQASAGVLPPHAREGGADAGKSSSAAGGRSAPPVDLPPVHNQAEETA